MVDLLSATAAASLFCTWRAAICADDAPPPSSALNMFGAIVVLCCVVLCCLQETLTCLLCMLASRDRRDGHSRCGGKNGRWAGRLEGDWKTNPETENNLWNEGKPPNGRWGLLPHFLTLSLLLLPLALALALALRPSSLPLPFVPPPRSSLGRIYPSEEGSQVDNSSTLGC